MSELNLSSKAKLGVVTHTNSQQYYWVKVEDVREAVAEFHDDCYDEWKNNGSISFDLFQEKLLKHFGPQLTEVKE